MTKRGARGKMIAALHKRTGGSALPNREVMPMVTYDALFAYSLVIIGVIGLVIQIYKRK